jgi:hypothetical protein
MTKAAAVSEKIARVHESSQAGSEAETVADEGRNRIEPTVRELVGVQDQCGLAPDCHTNL